MRFVTGKPTFSAAVTGTSKTLVLYRDGEPVARFYAGKITPEEAKAIAEKLNA
jgi:hypothetical protein